MNNITKINDDIFGELKLSQLQQYKKVIDERIEFVKNNPIVDKEKYWLAVDFYYGDADRNVDYTYEIDYKTYQALEQCDKTKEYEMYDEFLGCPEGTINHFCRWFKSLGSKDYTKYNTRGDWQIEQLIEDIVKEFDLEFENTNFKKESLDRLLAEVDMNQELLKLDKVLDSDITINNLTNYLTYFDKNLFKILLKLHILKNDPFDFSFKNIFASINATEFKSIGFDWYSTMIEVCNEEYELVDFCLLEDDFEVVFEITDDYLISKGLITDSNDDWNDVVSNIYDLLIDIKNVREFMLMVKSQYS